MVWLIDILKSRGKFGGIGLIVLGVGVLVAKFFTSGGAEPSGYTEGIGCILAGLALLGIRAKQG